MTANATCVATLIESACRAKSSCTWSCSSSTASCSCQDDASTLIIIIICTLFGFVFFGLLLCCCYYSRFGASERPFGLAMCPCAFLCDDPPLPPGSRMNEYGGGGGALVVDQHGNLVMMNSGPVPNDPYAYPQQQQGVMLPPRGQNRWRARQGRSVRHRRFYPATNEPDLYAQPPRPPLQHEYRIAPDGARVVETRFADGRVAYATETQESLEYDDDELYDGEGDGYYEDGTAASAHGVGRGGAVLKDDFGDEEDGGDAYRRQTRRPPPAHSSFPVANEPIASPGAFRVSRTMESGGGGGGGGAAAVVPPPLPPHLARNIVEQRRQVHFRE